MGKAEWFSRNRALDVCLLFGASLLKSAIRTHPEFIYGKLMARGDPPPLRTEGASTSAMPIEEDRRSFYRNFGGECLS